MRFPSRQMCFVVLLAVSCWIGKAAIAQSLVGSIGGVVTDSTGAIVPGASVTVVNQATNDSRQRASQSTGTFTVVALPPGVYRVRIEAKGFSVYQADDISVTPGVNTRIQATLLVGSSETVNVSSSTQGLQTDSATVRTEIGKEQIEIFPAAASRNIESALILVPGVTPPVNSGSFAANPSRGLYFSSNGSFGNTNNVRIDGAPAVNVYLPNVAAYSPGLEAVDSVTVVNNTYNAQDGLAGGASVNIHLKTGSNKFHGSAYEYYTGNALTAKPYFLPSGFTSNPRNVENTPGGTLGGPILKDRLFFFGSYDGWFVSQSATTISSVPTAAMRMGNFADSPTPLYDPNTGTATGAGKMAFTGNMVPNRRQSTIAQQIQADIPLPNLPGIANNYFSTGRFTIANVKYDADLTWAATKKINVEARYGQIHLNVFDSPALGAAGGPAVSSAGGRVGANYGNVYSATGSVNYLISNNFVYNAFYTATLLALQNDPGQLDTPVGLNLGIPGTNGPGRIYGGSPLFSISSFSSIGNVSAPFTWDDRDNQINNSFTYTRGAHTIVFGGNIEREILAHTDGSAGTFTFTGAGTTVAGGKGADAYHNYADFLLGNFATGTAMREFNGLKAKWFQYSLFAQDQYTVSPRFTISYGLRWDYLPIGGRDHRGYERYNYSNNTMTICGVANNPHDCGYGVSKLNFSPNLGITFRIAPSTVLLAGGGLNRDPYPLTGNRDLLTNFPNVLTSTIRGNTSTTTAGTLATGLPDIQPIDISSGIVPVPATYDVISAIDNNKRDYVETWNLGLQTQWQGGLTTSIRYVGSRQVDVTTKLDSNAGLPGGGSASQPLKVAFGRTANTFLMVPVAHNQYDALQTQAVERIGRNFLLTTNFTWSKAFAFCCDRNAGETLTVNAPGYLGRNRALSVFNQQFVFTASGLYKLPFGHGQRFLTHGIAGSVVGGWQISGIQEIYSGLPFNVTASATSLNAPGSSQTADRVRNGTCTNTGFHPGDSYIDPTCFAPVNAARFGTAGQESTVGPGVKVLNANLDRVFRIHDMFLIDFKAEAFNVSNTPHFSNPSSNISSVIFNPDGSVKSLNGFGSLNGVNSRDQEGIDQRFFRVGAKVSF